MASIPTTALDDFRPLSPGIFQHGALERQLSGRDGVAPAEDKVVVSFDRSKVVVTDVAGSKSQNGDVVLCPIITTVDASAEPVELASSDVDGSFLKTDVPDGVPAESLSSVQALNAKMKLVRCPAVCDDASPSPTPPLTNSTGQTPVVIAEPSEVEDSSAAVVQSEGRSASSISPTIQVNSSDRTNQGQTSSHGSTVSDGGPSPAMSRDSSVDNAYTDSTGTNLEDFIIKTLNKNKADRSIMMRLEADLTAFVNDSGKEKWKFPPMTSYLRMLVHRVAAFYGLDHNVDENGKCVIVSRLPNTRVPDFKFRDHLGDDFLSDDQPKKSILKRHRDCTSLEENLGVDRIMLDERKSKSFEERTEVYREARSRIFKEMPESCRKSSFDCKEVGGDDQDPNSESGGAWRSAEFSGYRSDSLRVATSFQNVTVLTRGDGQTGALSSGREPPKADGCVIGLPATVSFSTLPEDDPNPPASDNPPAGGGSWGHAGGDGPSTGSPFLSFTDDHGEPLAIWVASTISQIPPGSIIINPKKGEPYTNPDGTVYRWYPPTHLVAKDCRASDEFVPRAKATSTEQPSGLTEQAVEPPQEFVRTSVSSDSKTIPESVVVTKSVRVSRPHVSKPNSSSGVTVRMPPPPSVLSFPPDGRSQPSVQTYVNTNSSALSNRHLVPPPPAIVPAYSGNAGPAPPIRFVCPQAVGYPSAPEQQPHALDAAHYGYVPTYPTAESFQVTNFPAMGVPLPPAECYQQTQRHVTPQPVAVVQYPDKTWNQYSQPLTVLPGRGSVATAPVYYTMDPSLGTQSGIPPQYPIQLVVVSSASGSDPTQGQPHAMMTGGMVVPANTHPTYLGSGPSSSGAQPQFVQYTYQPNQALGGGATAPVMPFYQNVLAVPVPSAAPLRAPTPCLIPVVRPPAPVGVQGPSHRSASPKSFQFSAPPPPSGGHLRASSVDLPGRPLDCASDPIQLDPGLGQVPLSNRPALNPRQPRFSSVRQSHISFPHSANINTGDSRFPRPPNQRMIPPAFRPNYHPKSRVTTPGAPVAAEVRKSGAPPQPRVGVTAEGSAVLEVCAVPPAATRHKDLTTFGAKEYHIHNDPQARPKDVASVGSAPVAAIFDPATGAQRALRDHHGNGYRLQTATRSYNLNHHS